MYKNKTNIILCSIIFILVIGLAVQLFSTRNSGTDINTLKSKVHDLEKQVKNLIIQNNNLLDTKSNLINERNDLTKKNNVLIDKKNNLTDENNSLHEKIKILNGIMYSDDISINLLNLSDEELSIYNNFRSSYDDEVLRDVSAYTICKLYIHAGYIKDYETEYEFHIDKTPENEILNIIWYSKDEWISKRKRGEIEDRYNYEKLTNINDLNIVAAKDGTEILWNPKSDYEPAYWVYSCYLLKNDKGIFKALFMLKD